MNKQTIIPIILLFMIGLMLVFSGHKNIGFQGLMTMVLGIGCLLSSLFIYNKPYR